MALSFLGNFEKNIVLSNLLLEYLKILRMFMIISF